MICSKLGMKLFLVGVVASSGAHAQDAVRIAPDNPKYLWFRGKPLVLISASEHYGSVINRPFDYEKYLADAADASDDHDADVSSLSRAAKRSQSFFTLQAGISRLHLALCAHRSRQSLGWRAHLRPRSSGTQNILNGCITFWRSRPKTESSWSSRLQQYICEGYLGTESASG